MNSKRIISIILACLMIFSLVPAVSAEEEHTHEWTETVYREANCAENVTGIVNKRCECGESVYEDVGLCHEVTDVFVAATCTEAAFINVYCTKCENVVGTKKVEGESNVALGHDLYRLHDDENNKAETCTEAGVAVMKCSRCDYTVTDPAAATGHKWAEEGTETGAGCEHGAGIRYECLNGCGAVKVEEYTDDRAEAALGHDFTEEVTAPTCKDEGYTTVTCSRCDYNEKKDTVPVDKNAHKLHLTETVNEPTCTVAGTGRYTCELCEADLGYKAIAPEHDWVPDPDGETVEPTCGKDGTQDMVCVADGCGEKTEKILPATGEHSFADATTRPTCTEPAMAGLVCQNEGCDATKGALTAVIGSKPLGHDMVVDTDHEDYKAATCTEGGLDTLKCSRCDLTEQKATDALGHEWAEEGYETGADCEHGAGVRYDCLACDGYKVEEYTDDRAEAALGHDLTEEVTAPTCKEEGYTTVTCERDGCDYEEIKDKTPVDPDAHAEKLVLTLEEASCTEAGTGKYVCELCEADLGYKAIPAGHKWVDVEITKAPTCAETGLKSVVCSVCKATENDVKIPATGEHDYVETYREATCTEPAMAGELCSVCGGVNGKLSVVEGSKPLGHDMVVDTDHEDYKASTCTEAGVDTMKCSRCDHTETRMGELLEHKWDGGVWTDAGCENPAGILRTCTVCETVEVEAVTGELAAEATGHSYKETVVAPTCTNKGAVYMICSACGDSQKIEGTDTDAVPDAHVPFVAEVIKEANCFETGIVKIDCSECELHLTYETTPITHKWGEEKLNDGETALIRVCTVANCGAVEIIETYEGYECEDGAHVAVIDAAVDATCTANGITEGSHCKLCGEVITAQEIVPATGHTEEIIPSVEASCTEEGLSEGKKCSVCGEVLAEQETVPALGHTEETLPAVEASCTEEGLSEGKKCSVCGEVLAEQKAVPALGHTEETLPAVEASCTEEGLSEGKKCSVCGEVLAEQKTVPALGHDFAEEFTVDKEATADEAGSKSRHCSRCDEVTDVTEIPKLKVTVDSSEAFKDIVVKKWSKDAIDYVVTHGYMNGTSEDTFTQEGTLTRSMFVTILWRLAGKPSAEGESPFTDLDAGSKWYHEAVLWGYENEIVMGTGDTTFDPNGKVSREQMAVFLYRFAKYMEYDTTAKAELSQFSDAATVSSWAKTAMEWAVAEGLIAGTQSGDGKTALSPKGDATREQTAVILMRFCEKY